MTEQKVFNIEDELPRIAFAFNGMDSEYVKLVRDYHTFYLDDTRTDAARYEFSPGIKRPESLTIWDETGNVVLEGPVRDLVDRLHQVKWPELYGPGRG